MKIRYIVILVCLIVCALVSLLLFDSDRQRDDTLLQHTYLPCKQKQRIWKNYSFDSNNLVTSISGFGLAGTIQVEDSSIYVFDYGLMKLKRYSIGGHLQATIGNGVGRGPGELLGPVDFQIQDQKVWILDAQALTIEEFTVNGRYIDQINIRGQSMGMAFIDDNIVIEVAGSSNLFLEIAKNGKKVNSFGSFLKNQIENTMSTQGKLLEISSSNFIYVPRLASYIFYFNRSGSIYEINQIIDHQAFQSSIIRSIEGGGMIRPPRSNVINNSISVYDGIIYVQTMVKKRGVKLKHHSLIQNLPAYNEYVDRYRVDDGKYLSSTRIPFPVLGAIVKSGRIYCMSDTMVTVYKGFR